MARREWDPVAAAKRLNARCGAPSPEAIARLRDHLAKALARDLEVEARQQAQKAEGDAA